MSSMDLGAPEGAQGTAPRWRGVVKWFNDAKGFGFITATESGCEVFVHHSHIRMDGFRVLRPGVPVHFELLNTDRGLHARDVVAGPEGA